MLLTCFKYHFWCIFDPFFDPFLAAGDPGDPGPPGPQGPPGPTVVMGYGGFGGGFGMSLGCCLGEVCQVGQSVILGWHFTSFHHPKLGRFEGKIKEDTMDLPDFRCFGHPKIDKNRNWGYHGDTMGISSMIGHYRISHGGFIWWLSWRMWIIYI